MRGRDWLASLGGGGPDPAPAEWLDVLVHAIEQHPGRGEAARWLAGEMGVDVRSAQRYLKLDQQPKRGGPAAAAKRLQRELDAERKRESDSRRRGEVADLIDAMSTLDAGHVEVSAKSTARDHGSRTIGRLDNMHDGLAKVADAWRDGDEDLAEEMLSDAIMARYDGRDSDDTEGLASFLFVTDYTDGIDYA